MNYRFDPGVGYVSGQRVFGFLLLIFSLVSLSGIARAEESANRIPEPSFYMSFPAASMGLNTSSQLSFTIRNESLDTSLTGIGFILNLPAGLVVSTPPGGTGSCGGGTLAAVAGSSVISLTGAALAADSECNFSFSLTATSAGFKSLTALLISNEYGNGPEGKTAITVFGPTAANVTVAGSVLSRFGLPLQNAVVSMTDSNGAVRSVRTNSFGRFTIDSVGAGEEGCDTVLAASVDLLLTFPPPLIPLRPVAPASPAA